MSVLIIAEAGVNHNGDLELAKKLIDAAAYAGADIVKFQTFNAEKLATKSAPKANYQIHTTGQIESQRDMLKKLELGNEEYKTLVKYCKKMNIEFLTSAFDIENLNKIRELEVQRIKVASGEITNLPYLRVAGSLQLPILLSTGMSSLGEIEAALEALEGAGAKRQQITVLHCNTEYPTPMVDVNLRAMGSIKCALGVEVGYSDHTIGTEVAISAVALGATVIEKHLTLDRNLDGPDHKASIEPSELEYLVNAVRNIEKALGSKVKRCTASELENKPIARKSIVAAKPIEVGEVLTEQNLTTKRPGDGLSPMEWDNVVGKVAKKSFQKDDMIEL